MKVQLIKNVSKGTWSILSRKVPDREIKERIEKREFSALGLCQGDLADMLVASDLAEKSSAVCVSEIHGTCPQHIVCIGIFGETSAVENAVRELISVEAEKKGGRRI